MATPEGSRVFIIETLFEAILGLHQTVTLLCPANGLTSSNTAVVSSFLIFFLLSLALLEIVGATPYIWLAAPGKCLTRFRVENHFHFFIRLFDVGISSCLRFFTWWKGVSRSSIRMSLDMDAATLAVVLSLDCGPEMKKADFPTGV